MRVMRGEVQEEREIDFFFFDKMRERVLFGKVKRLGVLKFEILSDSTVTKMFHQLMSFFITINFLFARAQHFSVVPNFFGFIGDEFSFSSPMILIFFSFFFF